VERISISINNSISTINSQNICFWTYTVGLLAAVATGEVVGLMEVATVVVGTSISISIETIIIVAEAIRTRY